MHITLFTCLVVTAVEAYPISSSCAELCETMIHHTPIESWPPDCVCSDRVSSMTRERELQDGGIYFEPADTITLNQLASLRPYLLILNPAVKFSPPLAVPKVVNKRKTSQKHDYQITPKPTHHLRNVFSKELSFEPDSRPLYLDIDIQDTRHPVNKTFRQSEDNISPEQIQITEENFAECVNLHLLVYLETNNATQLLELRKIDTVEKNKLTLLKIITELKKKCQLPANILEQSLIEIKRAWLKHKAFESSQTQIQEETVTSYSTTMSTENEYKTNVDNVFNDSYTNNFNEKGRLENDFRNIDSMVKGSSHNHHLEVDVLTTESSHLKSLEYQDESFTTGNSQKNKQIVIESIAPTTDSYLNAYYETTVSINQNSTVKDPHGSQDYHIKTEQMSKTPTEKNLLWIQDETLRTTLIPNRENIDTELILMNTTLVPKDSLIQKTLLLNSTFSSVQKDTQSISAKKLGQHSENGHTDVTMLGKFDIHTNISANTTTTTSKSYLKDSFERVADSVLSMEDFINVSKLNKTITTQSASLHFNDSNEFTNIVKSTSSDILTMTPKSMMSIKDTLTTERDFDITSHMYGRSSYVETTTLDTLDIQQIDNTMPRLENNFNNSFITHKKNNDDSDNSNLENLYFTEEYTTNIELHSSAHISTSTIDELLDKSKDVSSLTEDYINDMKLGNTPKTVNTGIELDKERDSNDNERQLFTGYYYPSESNLLLNDHTVQYSTDIDDLTESTKKISHVLTREFQNDTVVSKILATEAFFKEDLLNYTSTDSPETTISVTENKHATNDEISERTVADSYVGDNEKLISGQLYFLFDKFNIPARFMQKDDGDITIGINGKALCGKIMAQKNSSLIINLICNCMQQDNCTSLIN